MLPPLTIGQVLGLDKMLATQRFSRPAARYTEASLVKEAGGNGNRAPLNVCAHYLHHPEARLRGKRQPRRQGTPVPILTLSKDQISSAQTKTEMVGAEKAKLFPTDMAMVVNDFLVEHFPNVVDFKFTAHVEEEFDEIAAGEKQWDEMIGNFYGGFHQQVENTDSVSRTDVGKASELGTDPETGQKMFAKLGRFGPFIQLGEEGDGITQKPLSASLRKGQFLETITVDEALELFKLPRMVGTYEDKDMSAALGRFGPYIKHGSKYYSLLKGQDPHNITSRRLSH